MTSQIMKSTISFQSSRYSYMDKKSTQKFKYLDIESSPQEDDEGQFYQGLRDLKCSPTPRGLSQMRGLKFLHFSGGQQGFLYWGDRGSPSPNGQELLIPPTRKSLPSRLPPPNFYSPYQRFISPNPLNSIFLLKNFFFRVVSWYQKCINL